MAFSAKSPDGRKWSLDTIIDRDSDGFDYNEHYAVTSNGERRHLGWSRFQNYDLRHFAAFVEAGFPKFPDVPRRTMLPADIEELPSFVTDFQKLVTGGVA